MKHVSVAEVSVHYVEWWWLFMLWGKKKKKAEVGKCYEDVTSSLYCGFDGHEIAYFVAKHLTTV